MNTFITINRRDSIIMGIQQTIEVIPNSTSEFRYIAVPVIWFGQIFSISGRYYDLVESRSLPDLEISSERTFISSRIKPVLEDT